MSKLKATFCRHLHATWLDAVGGWPSAAHGLETDAQYRQAVSGMHNLLARLQKLAQDWFEAGEAFIQARNNARDEKRKQVREEKRKYEEIKRTIQNHETLKKKLAEDLHALLRTLTNLTPLVEPQTLSEYYTSIQSAVAGNALQPHQRLKFDSTAALYFQSHTKHTLDCRSGWSYDGDDSPKHCELRAGEGATYSNARGSGCGPLSDQAKGY